MAMPMSFSSSMHPLSRKNTAHATVRLSNFVQEHSGDTNASATGDTFVRKMNTYGMRRPSVAFTQEARAVRPLRGQPQEAMDMSSLPPTWNDPRSDNRELTLEYPLPGPIDDSFMELYKNHSLMTPSERYQEHLVMKAGEKAWREAKESAATYKKRMTTITNHHSSGILGIDGPLFDGTRFFGNQKRILEKMQADKEKHANDRYKNLAHRMAVDEATRHSLPEEETQERSRDIYVLRKSIDPVMHPQRFLNTQERLFPAVDGFWDPGRAKHLRSHDTRGRSYNILSGSDSSLTYHRMEANKPFNKTEPEPSGCGLVARDLYKAMTKAPDFLKGSASAPNLH